MKVSKADAEKIPKPSKAIRTQARKNKEKGKEVETN